MELGNHPSAISAQERTKEKGSPLCDEKDDHMAQKAKIYWVSLIDDDQSDPMTGYQLLSSLNRHLQPRSGLFRFRLPMLQRLDVLPPRYGFLPQTELNLSILFSSWFSLSYILDWELLAGSRNL